MEMFRYLLKYVGKYNVQCYKDLDTGNIPCDEDGKPLPDYDDLYIPCKLGGVIKHTYKPGVLVWYCDKLTTAKAAERQIKKMFPDIPITCEIEESEGMIYFNDSDFVNKLSKIFRPERSNERIGPFGEIVYNEYVKRKRGDPAPQKVDLFSK